MLNFSVTFLITLINLAILFVIMRAILFKPVRKFMEKRQAAVKNDIDTAAKQRADAEKLKAQYDEQMAHAREDGAGIINDARVAAEKQAAMIVAEAKKEAETMHTTAQTEIEQEKQASRMQFQQNAVALVLAAAAKLLQRQFSDEDSRREAALFLKQLGETNLG
jgi:F-type H+-transporting ATPase subunit b